MDQRLVIIGKNIQNARESKNMSRYAMGQALGYKSTCSVRVRKIENAEYAVTVNTLLMIADVLQCDVKKLFVGCTREGKQTYDKKDTKSTNTDCPNKTRERQEKLFEL